MIVFDQQLLQDAFNKLLEQYKNSYNLKKLLEIYITQIIKIQDQAELLYVKRNIDACEGEQLDKIGIFVDEDRKSRIDLVYRNAIFTKISINNSVADAESIINAIKNIYNPDLIKYKDLRNASFTFFIKSLKYIEEINELVRSIAPAGVDFSITQTDSDDYLILSELYNKDSELYITVISNGVKETKLLTNDNDEAYTIEAYQEIESFECGLAESYENITVMQDDVRNIYTNDYGTPYFMQITDRFNDVNIANFNSTLVELI